MNHARIQEWAQPARAPPPFIGSQKIKKREKDRKKGGKEKKEKNNKKKENGITAEKTNKQTIFWPIINL